MQKSILFIFTMACCIGTGSIAAQDGKTYYLRSGGNDAFSGTSHAAAWKTLQRASRAVLLPGDTLLLESGTTFEGSLVISSEDAGEAARPLVVSGFGPGRAMIRAGNSNGLVVHNTSGVHIANLEVLGDGVGRNSGTGILILADDSVHVFREIRIEHCHAEGFQQYGIALMGTGHVRSGWADVDISHCTATANGEGGIGSSSLYPSISHRNISVQYCKAYHNRGILTKTDSHSGNGIVMSGVDGLRIAYCEAWENGADNRSVGGGPVGIWVWDCRNAVMEYCISRNNHAGLSYDGGGFDIDGGCSGCEIRHCLSQDNEGAGFLICEFGSPLPFTGNKVTHCISRNDGLKNGYGAITVVGPSEHFQVTNTVISHNLIEVPASGVINGRPAAFYLFSAHYRGIIFEDNQVQIGEGAVLLRCDTLFTNEMARFRRNRITVPAGSWPVLLKGKESHDSIWKKRIMAE